MRKFSAASLLVIVGLLIISGCQKNTDTTQTEEVVEQEDAMMEEVMEADAMEEDEKVMTEEVMEQEDTETSQVKSVMNFTESAYKAAIASKKDIVLDFHADWCPVCVANEPVLNEAVSKLSADSNVVVFKVNYDESTDLKKQFGITYQSTFVMIVDGDTNNFSKYSGALDAKKATDILTF